MCVHKRERYLATFDEIDRLAIAGTENTDGAFDGNLLPDDHVGNEVGHRFLTPFAVLRGEPLHSSQHDRPAPTDVVERTAYRLGGVRGDINDYIHAPAGRDLADALLGVLIVYVDRVVSTGRTCNG